MAAPQYVAFFEGSVYGPFTTNNGTAADTDAQHWVGNAAPGSPVMELRTPSSFVPPFPISEATG